MTPKEKAAELVDKFTQTNGNGFFAKQSAIIAVDEIIKNGGTQNMVEYKPNFFTNGFWYWREVKQEIEKL